MFKLLFTCCLFDWQYEKGGGSSLEGEGPTPHSQPAQLFFTPEPSLRRANDMQAQLRYNTPINGGLPTTAPGEFVVVFCVWVTAADKKY